MLGFNKKQKIGQSMNLKTGVYFALMGILLVCGAPKKKKKANEEAGSMVGNMTPPEYNKDVSPSKQRGRTDYINFTIMFHSVDQVNFEEMDFETELMVTVTWKDERLTSLDDPDDHRYLLPKDTVGEVVWMPPIDYYGCKHCDDHSTLINDDTGDHIYFNPKTKLFYLHYRQTMHFQCEFDLSYYPLDVHECYVVLHYEHSHDDPNPNVVLVNIPDEEYDPTLFISRRFPPEFRFISLRFENRCPRLLNDNHSHCLRYTLRFKRIMAHHIMLLYIPSLLIVMISWMSFWLDMENAAPRVALGLTSLLTLTTQFSSAQKNLPAVAYVKAVDVWMITCVLMVFGSLLEFAIATQVAKKKITWPTIFVTPKRPDSPRPPIPYYNSKGQKTLLTLGHFPKALPTIIPAQEASAKRPPKVNFMDKIARVLFPLIFLVFNIIYWTVYTQDGGEDADL